MEKSLRKEVNLISMIMVAIYLLMALGFAIVDEVYAQSCETPLVKSPDNMQMFPAGSPGYLGINPDGDYPLGSQVPCEYGTYGGEYDSGSVAKKSWPGEGFNTCIDWGGGQYRCWYYKFIQPMNSPYVGAFSQHYVIINSALAGTDPETNDQDNDGVPDAYDCNANDGNIGGPPPPDPWNEDGSTKYFALEKVYDADGNLIYQKIMTANDAGQITGVYEFGDRQQANDIKAENEDGYGIENTYYDGIFDDVLNLEVKSINELNDDLQNDMNGDPMELPISYLRNDEIDYDKPGDNQTGTTDPGSTETTNNYDYTDQNSAMIENQNAMIENQGNQRALTENTNQKLSELISAVEDQEMTITMGDVNIEGEGITQEEMQGIIDQENADSESAASGLDSVENPTFDSSVSEIVPEETPLGGEGGILDTLYNNNPVTGYVNAIQLQTSGDCQMSFDWSWGNETKTSTLSMCEYQDELSVFGTVLLSVTTILSVVMVVRR